MDRIKFLSLLTIFTLGACALKNNGEPYPGYTQDPSSGTPGGLIHIDPDFDSPIICKSEDSDYGVVIGKSNTSRLYISIYDKTVPQDSADRIVVKEDVNEKHTLTDRNYIGPTATLVIDRSPDVVLYSGYSNYGYIGILSFAPDPAGAIITQKFMCTSTGYSVD